MGSQKGDLADETTRLLTVQANFVAIVDYHSAFFRECLQGMTRDEPGCFHVVFIEELEETTDADRTSEETFDDGSHQDPISSDTVV